MRAEFLPIPGTEDYVAFFPDSVRYFRIGTRDKQILEAIMEDASIESLCDKFGISEAEYHQGHALLEETLGCSDLEDTGFISRLTINLTNNCNLACRYCYAHGGSYACEAEYMTRDTAKQVIDCFAAKFTNIFMIQFFGGEPLMNPDVMAFLCNYICEQSAKGVLNPGANERPRLVLMTNLSLLNEDIIGIIKKYGVSVTASIDGPEQINSITRPMKNGSSHADIVKEKIRMLKAATGNHQPQLIEVTYTALHQKLGISVIDVIRYCKETLGVERVHLLPAMVPLGHDCRIEDYSFLAESAREILAKMKHGFNYRFDKLEDNFGRLKYREKPRRFVCDAGQSQYSVSTDGDIYPCYALAGDGSLKMGNVRDSHVFECESYLRKRAEYAQMDRLKAEPCQSCFGNMMCHGCMAIYKALGSDLFTPAKTVCDAFRDILRLTLTYLGETVMRTELFSGEQ